MLRRDDRVSYGERLRMLSSSFRRFLLAVSLFGAGDFAHTLLILLSIQKLTPELGASNAAGIAVGLYVLHNVFYAGFAFIAGWLADRFQKNVVLASGYALAAVTALAIIFLLLTVSTLGAIFILDEEAHARNWETGRAKFLDGSSREDRTRRRF